MKLFDVYPLYDVEPVNAYDSIVVGKDGIEYLDLYGGHAVISVGHGHPHYVKRVKEQLEKIGFYSNAVQNSLQSELADKLGELSGYNEFQLFLCNSGAEANENALKLASFYTGKSRVVAFHKGFHGRTSAAVAATDNAKINSPLNMQQNVTFLPLNDLDLVQAELKKGDVCAVIIEPIQGVGGLDEGTSEFFRGLEKLCKENDVVLILDEVQAGFGRTGKFFAHQYHGIRPDIISIAKGMGNGFPIGGIMIAPHIEPSYGMLGTTFGGNHLACAAALSVLEILEMENLIDNAKLTGDYFISQAIRLPGVKKVKGKGLMLGLEFDFEVSDLRKKLIYDEHIFTGGAMNKKLLRILPPLTIGKSEIDQFIKALQKVLVPEKI
ncbi:aminotransferase class III-fold pyridoxal phosphate-dependent enzyme [Aquimarina sp. BL5]|uniref:aspartate aminotransferase family protein n=1 Tax=Aquimarina sp. BL5 TaxID=1714860 RepID=UPI000E4F1520|nr:aminotransferase class III-fold pyridoxal phosphate-dependent enzyme [Aquimarina sp. BL5]AXT50457.1 aminotransferase class III-fold pyridoxal phosphate-dependent enzyme [Aquimarina sp. BL5]RKM99849.1 aminotransferase class III-fold pyridoxal phosphate-dependent enzyme [Aquimarina sp. BL5]